MGSEYHEQSQQSILQTKKGDYMSSGRPTTDPKPHTIAVRVNEQTMYKLEQEATRTDRKVSEIVRDLITQNFK